MDVPPPEPAPENPDPPVRVSRRRRIIRRILFVAGVLFTCLVVLLAAGWVALVLENSGTPSGSAHSTGNDAEWLGHAWVDGRKGQAEFDTLAAQVRGTGIRDLLVHAGPFNDDGSLDPALRPRARWLTQAVHTTLPGVRVQAWLGAHPVPEHLHLTSAATRAAVLSSLGQVLDDGFDGVHLDFEPVEDGDADLVTVLHDAHQLTRQRGVLLSISASFTEPQAGMSAVVGLLPGPQPLWSGDYLHRLAVEVDQVALMAYDTWLPTPSTYGGYVRRATEHALADVPADVALLIGVPAYHEGNLRHHPSVETIAAALHGVRLALGDRPPAREFGVAVYVDFTATAQDWASYDRDWAHVAG